MCTTSARDQHYCNVEVVLDQDDPKICRSFKVNGVEMVDFISFVPDQPFVSIGPTPEDGGLDGTLSRVANVRLHCAQLSVSTTSTEGSLNSNPHDQILLCGGAQ